MKVKRYTIAEAQKDFERLIREAEQGFEVQIIDENKQLVKVVPFKGEKERKLATARQT